MAGEWFQGQTPEEGRLHKKRQSQLCTASDQDGARKTDIANQHVAIERQIYTPTELESCQITVRQAKTASARGKAIFVDVRSAADYESVHIALSLNIPEHALVSRAFLKIRPFIIVGKGYRTHELAKRCVSLKKKGFRKVSVIQGGIVSWIQAGYEVDQKNKSALKGIFTISPKDLVSTAGKQKWSIAGMGPERSRINKIFSSEKIVNIPANVARFEKNNHGIEGGFFNPTLVIGAAGYDVNLTRSLVRKGLMPVFYLDGGIENYFRYRRIHQKKVEHSAMALESIVKCPGT